MPKGRIDGYSLRGRLENSTERVVPRWTGPVEAGCEVVGRRDSVVTGVWGSLLVDMME